MSSQNHGLSSRSLAELALVVSRVAKSITDEATLPSVVSLQAFWQNTRSLQLRWTKELENRASDVLLETEQLEGLAPRLFACEMLVRTWSTVLVTLDRRRGTTDLSHVCRIAVDGLQQVRNELLSRMLKMPELVHDRMIKVDRLRRRCERWTDLLIGTIAAGNECIDFAYDLERAHDFGEEGSMSAKGTGPQAFEHFISAGLRLTFLQHLSAVTLNEPEFVNLSQSILSSLPHRAFHRDGSLRTSLEQRIAASHRQIEYRSNFELAAFFAGLNQVAPRR